MLICSRGTRNHSNHINYFDQAKATHGHTRLYGHYKFNQTINEGGLATLQGFEINFQKQIHQTSSQIKRERLENEGTRKRYGEDVEDHLKILLDCSSFEGVIHNK